MTNKQIKITVSQVRSKKPSIDQRIQSFEHKILDLLTDPMSKYLSTRNVLNKGLLAAMNELRDGIAVD